MIMVVTVCVTCHMRKVPTAAFAIGADAPVLEFPADKFWNSGRDLTPNALRPLPGLWQHQAEARALYCVLMFMGQVG